METSITPPSAFRAMPWKNGLGTTLELARCPIGDEPFHYRLSMADVASDGPFSPFPGCDRILFLVAGQGLVLTHGEVRVQRLERRLAQAEFSGDEPTAARLIDGPIRDFNVIAARDHVVCVGLAVESGEPQIVDGRGALVLVFALDGDAAIRDTVSNAAPTLVPAGHLARVVGAGVELELTSRGAAIVALVRPAR